MKKYLVFLLVFALVLSLSACGQKAQNEAPGSPTPSAQDDQPSTVPAEEIQKNESEAEPTDDPDAELGGETEPDAAPDEPEKTEPPKLSDYVLDADWCEYEDINLPALNREMFGDELADQVETEMKELYTTLTTDLWDFEEEGGHGPSADYESYRFGSMVSILVAYDMASFSPEQYQMKAYCLDLNDQRVLDVNEVSSRYGFSLDAMKKQIADVRLGYYCYYQKMFFDFEADGATTIEDCVDQDLQNLDKMIQETPGNVLALDEDYFAICMTVCNPGAGAGYEYDVIYVGNDPDYVAFFNAPYGADLYLLANPDEEFLEYYPPDVESILDEEHPVPDRTSGGRPGFRGQFQHESHTGAFRGQHGLWRYDAAKARSPGGHAEIPPGADRSGERIRTGKYRIRVWL